MSNNLGINEYLSGDDWEIPVTFTKKNNAWDVSGATIKAAVVDTSKSARVQVISDTTLNENAIGADWANGLVIVEFTSAQTTGVASGKYAIEVQVEKDGKKLSGIGKKRIEVAQGTIL